MAKQMSIEEEVQAYREKLLERRQTPPKPKASPAEKLERLGQRLGHTEALLEGIEARRLKVLLRQATLLAEKKEYRRLYALTLEIAHLCRLQTLGLEETHPILTSLPPPPGLPSQGRQEDRGERGVIDVTQG